MRKWGWIGGKPWIASWYKWYWSRFRKLLRLKSLGKHQCWPHSCQPWVTPQLEEVPPPGFHTLFFHENPQNVSHLVWNAFRWHCSCFLSLGQLLRCSEIPLEVIGVLPIPATWECCLLFKPDPPSHCKHLHGKQVQGRRDWQLHAWYPNGGLDSNLSCLWSNLPAMSKVSQLQEVLCCNLQQHKKKEMWHPAPWLKCSMHSDLLSWANRTFIIAFFFVVVVVVALKRCSSTLWSLRLVVNSLKSTLFPFILAC